MFRFGADHEAGYVVEEDDGFVSGLLECGAAQGEWDLLLVAHANELCGFASLVRVDDRDLVGDNANGKSYEKVLVLTCFSVRLSYP